MSYTQEYLNLKQQVMNGATQYGSGRIDPSFLNDLSNIVFVVGDCVLGDDIHAIILSLIEEFNQIAAGDIRHNLELSQFFIVPGNVMGKEGIAAPENSEIVLKYIDSTIVMSNSKSKKSLSENGGGSRASQDIDCNVSRGLIRFFVKQKQSGSNCCVYTRIRVARIHVLETLDYFIDPLYQDNEEIRKIEQANNVAISKGQTGAIVAIANSGSLSAPTSNDVQESTKTINEILGEAKEASAKSQLSKMSSSRVMSKVPSQTSVDTANTVAKTIMMTPAAQSRQTSVVLVPSNEPISLQNEQVKSVSGVVGANGTQVSESDLSIAEPAGSILLGPEFENSVSKSSKVVSALNAARVNSRASVAVDANLAVVPTQVIASSRKNNVVASTKSSTANANAIATASKSNPSMSQNLYNRGSALVNDLGSAVVGLGSTVVTLTKDLAAMVGLTSAKAADETPVPTNDLESNPLPASHVSTSSVAKQNAISRLNSQLSKSPSASGLPANSINVSNSKTANSIVSNGNAQRASQLEAAVQSIRSQQPMPATQPSPVPSPAPPSSKSQGTASTTSGLNQILEDAIRNQSARSSALSSQRTSMPSATGSTNILGEPEVSEISLGSMINTPSSRNSKATSKFNTANELTLSDVATESPMVSNNAAARSSRSTFY
jgi:hypothetical protein